jgi:hypothetical protein
MEDAEENCVGVQRQLSQQALTSDELNPPKPITLWTSPPFDIDN